MSPEMGILLATVSLLGVSAITYLILELRSRR
mgnify:CR=1 FL=1